MNLKYFLVLIFLINFSVFSQTLTPYTSSVLLEFNMDNGTTKFGTGFFIADSSKYGTMIYLVTARHVLGDLDSNGKLIFNNSLLKVTRSSNLKSESNAFEVINLESSRDGGLLVYHKEEDIAILNIASIKNGITYSPLALDKLSFFKFKVDLIPAYSKDIILLFKDIPIAAPVYISGYPKTIGLAESPQFDNNKPLVRSGIISGFYPKNQTIILDFPAYGGFSGSPVYLKYKEKLKLIGMLTERIPYKENGDIDDLDNSGFSVALSSDIILSMLAAFKESYDKREHIFIEN
tara:strand:- start:9 stop:881 length:873 start_codon:yes stop_codon:yes gene_type:complete